MVLNILLFLLGLALIIKGGDYFVDSAVWIAKKMRIPTFIIGATIVSIATTMPELLVSTIAASEGQTEMAVGNAVGSVTANTSMILAIAMVAMTIVSKRRQYIKQCILLILSAAVLLVGGLLGKSESGYSLNYAASICLIVIFILFMVGNVISAKRKDDGLPELPEGTKEPDKPTSDQAQLNDKNSDKKKKLPLALRFVLSAENTIEETVQSDRCKLALNVLLFIVGAVGIVGGSRLMVDNGHAIATAMGIEERIIAVTLVAIGTSLPELVTTITAIVKKEAALSAGNIIGANIIDLTLILPISSLVAGKQLPISNESMLVDIPVCLGVCIIATLPLIIRQKSSRIQGIVLLASYAGYLGYMIYTIVF